MLIIYTQEVPESWKTFPSPSEIEIEIWDEDNVSELVEVISAKHCEGTICQWMIPIQMASGQFYVMWILQQFKKKKSDRLCWSF